MFDRYSERARRVVFFARYEASQYGSPYIETEHLLLGLLREDHRIARWFPGESDIEGAIRTEIEGHVTRRKSFPTSVEVPLTEACKKVLNLAAEEADRLGHRHVGTEHVLLALFRVEGSLAAKLLRKRGLRPEPIRELLAQTPGSVSVRESAEPSGAAIERLEGFLAGLKWQNAEELIFFFAKNADFIDASGKCWNREEIWKGFENIFAPYSKKNVTYIVESTLAETRELLVANVLWKNALLVSEQRAWMHRMSFVLLFASGNWEIILAQVTPVQVS